MRKRNTRSSSPSWCGARSMGTDSNYILHFKKIYDVIDEENSTYDPPGWIIRLRVDYSKVKNLHVFNSKPLANDLIVSTKVYKEIKKRKLNFGTSFGIHFCLNKDKYVTSKKHRHSTDSWHRLFEHPCIWFKEDCNKYYCCPVKHVSLLMVSLHTFVTDIKG